MIKPELINYLLPIFLYAETHYAFKGVYSRLKKKEPELVADVPHRIDPGQPIPVLLLSKDAHLYPIRIKDIEINLLQNDQLVHAQTFAIDQFVDTIYWWKVFEIDRPHDIYGQVQLNATFRIEYNGKLVSYKNDNYRISSHAPFDVFLANDGLPKSDGWHFGDLHYHTNYTADQVEFGAPLEATAAMSHGMGLSFFAATDHSYDLDDLPGDPLTNDPGLEKWQRMKREVAQLNARSESNFVILPGEEVSCGNAGNRNVHMLVLNNSQFIPGKGDGAEKWLRTKPDLRVPAVLNQLEKEALAIAAHPEIAPPFLQWLLIRRGKWAYSDYLHQRMRGLQVWNGQDNIWLERGLERWVQLLLNNEKKFIFAGNDAHGNFNRFRQIGFPFWTMRENKNEIFGNARTCVYSGADFSKTSILDALRKGRVFVTNGPFGEIRVENEANERAGIGDEIAGARFKIHLTAKSSDEFGPLSTVRLLWGDISEKTRVCYR